MVGINLYWYYGNPISAEWRHDMSQRLIDKFINALTVGNRPIRIFFFGGVCLAYITMTLLGKIFGMDENIGGSTDFMSAVLMAVSLLIGFGVSYSIVRFADVIKQQRKEGKRQ